MDNKLFGYIQSKCPEFNRTITRGLACEQLQYVEQYIDNIIRCAEMGFPPGLVYRGCSRVPPQETFNTITAKRSSKIRYEFAKSDIYLMKYRFEFNGEELKDRFLFLPYVKEGGLITIMGSTFSISPVLADKAVSVGEDSIFIPLNRDKLTFKRSTQHFIMNGKRQSVNVVWSNIHHGWKKSRSGLERKTISANATMAHYLFCKYGLMGTFQKKTNVEVVPGNPDYVNEQNFPANEWYICESTKVKPVGVQNKFYQGTDIRVAVRQKDYTPAVASLIGGFFYVADRFPQRMHPEYLEEQSFWKTLMGHVIHATPESEGKLLNRIETHMESLDGYIDGMVKEWLHEDGVMVDDIYELFMHVVETFSARITESSHSLASMYDKRLMVLRYVLIDIIKAIFNMMFALQVAAKKPLAAKDVEKVFLKFMRPLLIIRINHKHNEVSSVSSPSDNMAFKITSNLVLQSDIGSGGSASKTMKLDASRVLHQSIAEVGQFNNLPKGEPTGRRRLNPMVRLGHQWSIERNPEIADLLDEVGEIIQR